MSSGSPVRTPQIPSTRGAPGLLAGVLVLAAALPIAGLVSLLQGRVAPGQEQAVALTFGLYLVILVGTALAYWYLPGSRRHPAGLAFTLAATTAVLLAASYLFRSSSQIFFRADILLWSESDFVNDILKFRLGHPLFTAPANLESFTYPPGTQLLTYLLAGLAGHGTSIPAYRLIQLLYVAAATVLVAGAAGRLIRRIGGESAAHLVRWWPVLGVPLLFLVATNRLTNPFVHNLHDDALTLLVTAIAFRLLVAQVERPRLWVLAAMALLPAAGFVVKQSLAILAPLFCLHLLLFDSRRSFSRALLFGVVAFGALGLVVGAGFLLWGHPFWYWVFTVLGSHAVDPLRSFDHLLDVWFYVALALLAGVVLVLRRPDDRGLLGLWVFSLLLLAAEIYTSGVAWMRNHIGPGSLLAGAWLVAALTIVGRDLVGWDLPRRSAAAWLRGAAAFVVLALALQGLGAVRIPLPGLPPDANRYADAISHEFAGLPAERILLDVGTWMYLPAGVVMKDRSPAAGEVGYTGTGDFSGMLGRIRQHYYAKILVRDLHEPDFMYDYAAWAHSSGIRQALLQNYREVRVIPGVRGSEFDPPWFRPISVLEPLEQKADMPTSGGGR